MFVPYAVLARRLTAGICAFPALLTVRRGVGASVGGDTPRLLAARVLRRVDILEELNIEAIVKQVDRRFVCRQEMK